MVAELIGNNMDEERILQLWGNCDIKTQNEELTEIIEKLVIDNRELISKIWKNTNQEVQSQKLEEVITSLKDNIYIISMIWCNTTPEVQIDNNKLLSGIIETVKNSTYKLSNIWYELENIWNYTCSECQEINLKDFLDIIENKSENDFKRAMGISDFWGKTKQNVQKANSELFPELIEYVNEQDDYSAAEMWLSTNSEIQESNSNIFTNLIRDNRGYFEIVKTLWKNASANIQKESEGAFPYILEACKEKNIYEILELWRETCSEIQKEYCINLIKELKKIDKSILYSDTTEAIVELWKSTDKDVQQSIFIDLLGELETIENFNRSNDIRSYVEPCKNAVSWFWGEMEQEFQKENLENILEKEKNKLDIITEIWRYTDLNITQNKENIYLLMKNVFGDATTEELEEKTNVYLYLLNKNKELEKTINFGMFKPNIMMQIQQEKLLRITADPYIQDKILAFEQNDSRWEVVKYVINNSTNWIMELHTIIENINHHDDLLNNLTIEDIQNDSTLKRITNILMENENYFSIKDINQVNNFNEIKKQICIKILNNQEIDNMSDKFYELSEEDKMRFAILELCYGMDIKEATNIVKKYGEDVNELSGLTKQENILKDTIVNLKTILESDNIQEIYQQNSKTIENLASKHIDYTNKTALEAETINMYARMYEDTLYIPKQEEKKQNEIYIDNEGKEHSIEIYEIDSDFNMFVRVEGAYTDWEEPENFLDDLNRPHIRNHGNCKSYIGQNCLATARENGVMYGYCQCEEGSLLLAAPWDLNSNIANKSFSTSNVVKWDFHGGIQFRKPNRMIDTTRHSHNETVSDRIQCNDNGEIEKEKPQYIVVIKESSDEEFQENDDKWRMAKKAAAQLGVPICIIDREKFAQRETEKIENMKNIFLGKVENISDEELLDRMIVEFENNRTGMRYAEKINKKYFTDRQREELLNSIESKIASIQQENPQRYENCMSIMRKVLENEINKGITSTGVKIPEIDTTFYEAKLEKYMQKSPKQIQDYNKKLTDIYKKYKIKTSDLLEVQQNILANLGKAPKDLENQTKEGE